jgi:hypothetical protein
MEERNNGWMEMGANMMVEDESDDVVEIDVVDKSMSKNNDEGRSESDSESSEPDSS